MGVAEDAGVRKRKRGVGVGGDEVEEEEEEDADGDGGAGRGAYEKDLLGEDGDDDGGGARYEGIAEEAVAEVMRWLEAEITDAPPPPTSDAGFVTINGNEESCGPSFSAAASTVMASVDTRAGAPPPPPVPWPWPENPQAFLPTSDAADMVVDAAGAPTTDVDVEMDLGGGDADEEWLARLLTCGGPLLEGVL
ncbi:hypothetical protein BAE44_0002272 [Dichanthelium oligosanthes]|uniref:Uncharacterized protein n=1 Tax=Dichanthelium oligosanthes TaxID=888268 RepID=A0A1E5WH69_9POAL|nr:hypothetical protein BAE44_0002272 [Dichanthelium oligosanthes]